MFTKIYNVVIAVNNLEEAVKQYTESFGLKVSKSGPLPQLGIKNAFLPVGDAVLELIEPLDHEKGPVANALKARGEGLYMIELEVKDIEQAVQAMTKKGVRLLGADPASRAKGVPVFIHPQSTKGVLIQLVQHK